VRGHEGVSTQTQRRVEHGIAGPELSVRDKGVGLALGGAKDSKVGHAHAGAVGAGVRVQVGPSRAEHEHRGLTKELGERPSLPRLDPETEPFSELPRFRRVAAGGRRDQGAGAERSPGAREA